MNLSVVHMEHSYLVSDQWVLLTYKNDVLQNVILSFSNTKRFRNLFQISPHQEIK